MLLTGEKNILSCHPCNSSSFVFTYPLEEIVLTPKCFLESGKLLNIVPFPVYPSQLGTQNFHFEHGKLQKDCIQLKKNTLEELMHDKKIGALQNEYIITLKKWFYF